MSGTVVVDASLAIAWVVQEIRSEAARALLLTWERQQVRRVAPALFAAETASALMHCARLGSIAPQETPVYLAALLDAVSLVPSDGALAQRALAIARQLGQGRAYDSFYAALAEQERCELWTADARFASAARRGFPSVHCVDEQQGTGTAD